MASTYHKDNDFFQLNENLITCSNSYSSDGTCSSSNCLKEALEITINEDIPVDGDDMHVNHSSSSITNDESIACTEKNLNEDVMPSKLYCFSIDSDRSKESLNIVKNDDTYLANSDPNNFTNLNSEFLPETQCTTESFFLMFFYSWR